MASNNQPNTCPCECANEDPKRVWHPWLLIFALGAIALIALVLRWCPGERPWWWWLLHIGVISLAVVVVLGLLVCVSMDKQHELDRPDTQYRKDRNRWKGGLLVLAWLVGGLGIVGLTFATLAWRTDCGQLAFVSVAFAAAFFLTWLITYFWLSRIAAIDSGACAAGYRRSMSPCADFTKYEKVLLEQFRYHTDRLNKLNTWRDAFILAFLVGYGSGLAVVLNNAQAVEGFLGDTDGSPYVRAILPLICGIVGIVGLFVLRRLAADRAHAVGAVNQCIQLQEMLGIRIGETVPLITGQKQVQPAVSVGSQWTSDMIVGLLNAVPFTASIVLVHINTDTVSLCAKQWCEAACWVWLAMVFAQLLAYTIWTKATPTSFRESDTQRGS